MSRRTPRDTKLRLRQQAQRSIGKVIAGRYRILDVLGQGGFGTVFLVEALDGVVGERLALKVIHPTLAREDDVRERFVNEIRVAMKIVHRYVTQIRDVGVTSSGVLYYTMDYFPGVTLGALLRRDRRLTIEHSYAVVRKSLRALSTAHAHGIIHRDLKPGNIMVAGQGKAETVRVLDFGIATSLREDRPAERGIGSLLYMAPEQLRGEKLGRYTDLYAMGVVLYQCLTGRRPHEGRTVRQVHLSITSTSPPAPSELVRELADYSGIDDVVLRALAPDPATRYATAKEFCTELIDVFRRAQERRERSAIGRLKRLLGGGKAPESS